MLADMDIAFVSKVRNRTLCFRRLEEASMQYFRSTMMAKDIGDELIPRHKTRSNSALLFKLFACASGRTHRKFTQHHRKYPYKTFGVLSGTSTIQQIDKDPRCVQDEYTRSLLTHFNGKLDAPELAMELYVIAFLANIDTATIEARHASIRRDIRSRVQTHALAVSRSSASFVLRAANAPRLIAGRPQDIAQTAEGQVGASGTRKKRCGGGPWRAFVSERARGHTGLPDISALSKE